MTRARRRRPLGTASVLVAVLLLAACGGPGGEGTRSTAVNSATVTGLDGPVRVPVTERDVWALDPAAALQLLAVGVVPTHAGKSPYASTGAIAAGYSILRKAGVRLVAPGEVEMITAARPSLIIGTDFPNHQEIKKQLGRLAPTLLYDTTSQTWQQQLQLLGRATGHEQQAAATVSRLEGRIAALGKRVRASRWAGVSVSKLSACGQQVCVYDDTRMSGALLRRLGLGAGPGSAKASNGYGYAPVSREVLARYRADVLFVYRGSVERNGKSVIADPMLDADRSRSAEVDFEAWYGNGPLDVVWVLRDVFRTLFGGGTNTTTADGPALWREVTGR